jgi:hypothetical protein
MVQGFENRELGKGEVSSAEVAGGVIAGSISGPHETDVSRQGETLLGWGWHGE